MGKVLGWLILIGIVGYAGYIGLHWIRVRLKFSDIKDKADVILSPTSSIRFNNIPDELMQHAKEKGIPLKRDSIKLFIDEWKGYRVLSFRYTDSLMLYKNKPLYFTYTFSETMPFRR
jgi:hypothetical protein